MLELFVEGDFADTFEVSPSVVENSAQFVVSVKNRQKIDYEQVQTIEFEVIFPLGLPQVAWHLLLLAWFCRLSPGKWVPPTSCTPRPVSR